MKWALLIAAILAGLMALVAIIGSLLPKKHQASLSARFKQSPETVWRDVTDHEGAVKWRTDLKAVERLPDPVWKETYRNGQSLPLEMVEAVPPRKLVGRIGPGLPFGGTWTFDIRPVEGGCLLTITEDGEVYNPIFRFVTRFMDQAATIRGYLRALGKKYGEEVAL